MRINAILLAALVAMVPAASQAVVVLSFNDPTGDQTGSIDATGMVMTIDETNGDYSIDVTADAANPFVGAFRINVNLFNATLNEFFQDVFNDFNEPAPVASVNLTGSNANLTDWLASHAIATSTLDGLGNPPGSTFFRTSVADLPFQTTCAAEDIIGSALCTTQALPSPGPLALVLPGALAALCLRRRRGRT